MAKGVAVERAGELRQVIQSATVGEDMLRHTWSISQWGSFRHKDMDTSVCDLKNEDRARK